MKKTILFGVVAILTLSCQNKPRYTTTSSNIDVVKKLVADYHASDWEAWRSNYADSAKIYHNIWGENATPEEIRDNLKGVLSNTSEYHFDEDPIFYEQVIDDKGTTWVNFWGNWRGTLKANGKELTIPVHLSCEMANGKIVNEYGFYNLDELTTALTAIKAANNIPPDQKMVKDALKKVVDSWNAHDISNFKEVSVKRFVRTTNGNVELRNIDDYENFMKTFVTAFPDFKVEVGETAIANSKAYVNWTVTGRHKGDFMGNPPTGKKMKIHGFSIWSMNNRGKFIREDAYFDNQSLYDQLGIAPPKAK